MFMRLSEYESTFTCATSAFARTENLRRQRKYISINIYMLQSLTSTLSCAEHFYGAECAVRLKCSIEWKNPYIIFPSHPHRRFEVILILFLSFIIGHITERCSNLSQDEDLT